MSQNYAPVVRLDEEEIWTPTVYLGRPYQDYTVSSPSVNIVYQLLFMGPANIAWVGEWSNMEAVRERYAVDPKIFDEFLNVSKTPIPNDVPNVVFEMTRRRSDEILALRRDQFLINLDKKEYVSLSEHTSDFQAIDILPCLTLVSAPETMSLDAMDIPFSGEWAFDTIRLSKVCPEGYKKKDL